MNDGEQPPTVMAVWTGQRQGDLLALTWTAYDGSSIRLRQSKRGRYVVIPVKAPLMAAVAEPIACRSFLAAQARKRAGLSR